jgi:5-methylthioribose kinase
VYQGEPCLIKEVGDGNLNLVFILNSGTDEKYSFVIKQALPYLRVVGDSWPLTRFRMRIESGALMLYNRLVPGLAPEVYDYDDDMSFVAMEFLGKHDVMRKPLVAWSAFLILWIISRHFCIDLFYTSDLYVYRAG